MSKFGSRKGLELSGLKRLFTDFGDANERGEIAKRVLKLWDDNGDGALSHGELDPLVSSTDGQLSLGELDRAVAATSLVKRVRCARARACTPGSHPRCTLRSAARPLL